jgi:hypothetical protein
VHRRIPRAWQRCATGMTLGADVGFTPCFHPLSEHRHRLVVENSRDSIERQIRISLPTTFSERPKDNSNCAQKFSRTAHVGGHKRNKLPAS